MMWQKTPDDYVIATGQTYSVREFVEEAFRCIQVNINWDGHGLDEVGKDNETVRVKINPKYFRPTEVVRYILDTGSYYLNVILLQDLLQGDAAKAKAQLGWKPFTTFKELVKEMVDSDIALMKKEYLPPPVEDRRFNRRR